MATALAGAIALVAPAKQADAALFQLTIGTSSGDLVAVLDGSIAGNVVSVTTVQSASFNGNPFPALGFVGTFTDLVLNGTTGGVGLVSTDGLTMDFTACDTAICAGNAFSIGTISGGSVVEVIVALDGDSVFEEFNVQAYTLERLNPTAVPEPGTLALFGIAGLALVAASRRRPQLPALATA
ncbi:PEP-CTERM sorting domain-containing protein [Falsiroseomonas oryzae]|uniref:PEP-CTERM sorting domain-containing protein n=1 Tax=Falsiroseomonas oryzae TaxID=2766473 RepID=UPI0022EA1949|nr:PEP-CTERM sorting domain-containing protein [Roseomonas sp. MO-31]